MELNNAANEFVGSPLFIVLVGVAGLMIAFALRLTFRGTKSEYRHNPDAE
jgi:hypothetical protein